MSSIKIGTSTQIDELCKWAYLSDREIRKDLVCGYIRDEDDYTSNFTSALRRNINCYNQYGLKATSFLLSTSQERTMGCDATIIVHSNGTSKIAVFEAKLPHLETKNKHWDYDQTATGLSHFSDQLNRQSKLPPTFAIFEMFYCEFDFMKQPNCMDDEVSSCIWHSDAKAFDKTRRNQQPWQNSDLINMLSISNINFNIADILRYLCNCRVGKPIHMHNPQEIINEFHLEGHILFVDFEQQNSTEED